MSILADYMQSLPLIAGVVIVLIVMMRVGRQRQAARGSTPADQTDRSAVRSAGVVRDQLDDLMVQLEELARTTSAQIETRFSKLEVLLTEADEKIARLESLLAVADGKAPLPARLGGNGVERPEHRRVYELADAGKNAVEIAQTVGRDVGEVELILALRKKG